MLFDTNYLQLTTQVKTLNNAIFTAWKEMSYSYEGLRRKFDTYFKNLGRPVTPPSTGVTEDDILCETEHIIKLSRKIYTNIITIIDEIHELLFGTIIDFGDIERIKDNHCRNMYKIYKKIFSNLRHVIKEGVRFITVFYNSPHEFDTVFSNKNMFIPMCHKITEESMEIFCYDVVRKGYIVYQKNE